MTATEATTKATARSAMAVTICALAILAAPHGASAGVTLTTPARATPAIIVQRSSPASATNTQLATVARLRVFFGHQSVGWNIIDGLGSLYKKRGVTAPQFRQARNGLPATGGYFAHSGIGSNGDPESKIADFAAAIRGGVGARVDAALMKLCYVDFGPGTDADAVFNTYRRTLAALAQEYPGVRFVHVTAPLTVSDPASNVVRQRFNALMRQAYGSTGRLFDLARIESTKPSGKRVGATAGGARYYALYRGYSSDGGHLNSAGAGRAAKGLVRVLAGSK